MRSAIASIVVGALAASTSAALAADAPAFLREAFPERDAERASSLIAGAPAQPAPVTLDAGILSYEFIGEHRLTWLFVYLDGVASPHTRESLTVVLELTPETGAAQDAAAGDALPLPAEFAFDALADRRVRKFTWDEASRAVPSPGSGALALAALACMAPRRRD
jgi:hypothetical protein